MQKMSQPAMRCWLPAKILSVCRTASYRSLRHETVKKSTLGSSLCKRKCVSPVNQHCLNSSQPTNFHTQSLRNCVMQSSTGTCYNFLIKRTLHCDSVIKLCGTRKTKPISFNILISRTLHTSVTTQAVFDNIHGNTVFSRTDPPWRVKFFGTDMMSLATLKELNRNM